MLLLILVNYELGTKKNIKVPTIEPFLMKSTKCCLKADVREELFINLIF
jgi:hypothetical protein